MGRARIEISKDVLVAFCQRHHIRRLSLFGSVLTDAFKSESDVDVLVEFQPGRTPGLLHMAELEIELSERIGRKVDLRTPAELSQYFRDSVLRTSETQYAEA